MSKARVGLIGLGMALKPHAESYLALQDRVEVAYGYSQSADRRAAFAAKYGFALANSIDDILSDKTVNIVSILTPPNTHLDLVERCAAAGKHILLEKPLEITGDRARALVDVCRRARVTLGIVFQHRFRPSALRLAALLGSGALGEVVGADVAVLNWRPQSYYDEPGRGDKDRDGGGVLLTQGIHTLDLFLSLAGPVTEVFGFSRTTPVHHMETEDLAVGVARLGNGALASMFATTSAYPGFPERINLYCEKGTAHLAGTRLDVRFTDGRTDEFGAEIGAVGAGADPMAFPRDYHQGVIEDFLSAVAEARAPRADGDAGLRVQALIEAFLDSGAKGSPVRLSG